MPTWNLETKPTRSHPLGAIPDGDGVHFSVFSLNATSIELLLFDAHDDAQPAQVVPLDPAMHKSYFFWSVYVKGLKPGAHYAYRVDGPRDVHRQGFRYNPKKVLIDPYSRGNSDTLWNRNKALGTDDNLAGSMRSVVIDVKDYDWEGDRAINRPWNQVIVYEMHVGGFTRHPSSGVRYPGTFRGIMEKIPYLKELGITTVEFLPIMEFDQKEVLRQKPDGSGVLTNYWGYSTIGFFAPENSYCVAPTEAAHVREFRDMVKALHRAGIGVILDVVFNHTNEGNHLGPTINFKGLCNEVYYHLVPRDRQYYMDYSGCGNTLNCNHPIVEKLITEALEYWVNEMHVDGFRFDEGSIFARGQDGAPMAYPPVVWNIELSEALLDTKIVAEAWDAAGLYQIGYYPGYRWAEWNGRFRDDIRRFVKGDPGLLGAVAGRISGSPDIYQASGHLPTNSVNFVTCHDGFTLHDLVSYDSKHNEANGEGNRDGNDDNLSWNCGVEGKTADPTVRALRERQMKNFATILLLSQGVPMITMGDEVCRTQQGNNNAYCQDNEISWFDWGLVKNNQHMFRFWKLLIQFRKQNASLHRSRFFTGKTNNRGLGDISCHGCKLFSPGWEDPNGRSVAFTVAGLGTDADIHMMFNMFWETLEFEIPPVKGRRWYLAVDTAENSPSDFLESGQEKLIAGNRVQVQGRSVVVLISKDYVAQ
jgi:glycogen operon protein